MQIINLSQAKTRLSQLIDQALRGEQIVITKGGKPLVELMPYQRKKGPRKGERLRGTMRVSEDFDAPLLDGLMISQEQTEADTLSITDTKQEARQHLNKLRKKCKVGDVISPLNEKWKAKK